MLLSNFGRTIVSAAGNRSFGALVLHRMGRVVFGAADPLGGAVFLVEHLPPYVAAKAKAMTWTGPAWPELCDPLCQRALARYWSTSG